MAKRKIVTGIDIGSAWTKVVVAEYLGDGKIPAIIGTGISESKGIRHGYIINKNEAISSVVRAVNQAEKSSGERIKKAFISIGGVGLSSSVAVGTTFVSKVDGEITEEDVRQAVESSEIKIKDTPNKQIIHSIPTEFKLDGNEIFGRPVGMKGSKLEVKTLFITCLNQHIDDFIQTVEEADICVEDVMASPIAASLISLNKKQKTAGCVLANIGAETLSIVVFENSIPISLEVFPIGGTKITNDIALGFKIPLDEAELVKLGESIAHYPKKKLDEIIGARLSDIFDLIEAHLKKTGKNGLLPAGIVITGGSSAIPEIEELAKNSLNLPSRIYIPEFAQRAGQKIKDSTWSVAYGLCIMGLDDGGNESTGMKMVTDTKKNVVSWIKQFLP